METDAARTGPTIFTIGHSNHPLDTFLDLAEKHQIELIADVRSSPYSGYASQFDQESIRHHLQQRGIAYWFLGDLLGGRPEGSRFYDEEGSVLYHRLSQSPPFQRGIARLVERIEACRVALLCGEEDPTNCHRRRLIGRVLSERGIRVMHIRGNGGLQSEQELAKQEWFQKTRGQMTLFDKEEAETWKSTRSVSPRKRRPSSSGPSSGQGSGG